MADSEITAFTVSIDCELLLYQRERDAKMVRGFCFVVFLIYIQMTLFKTSNFVADKFRIVGLRYVYECLELGGFRR